MRDIMKNMIEYYYDILPRTLDISWTNTNDYVYVNKYNKDYTYGASANEAKKPFIEAFHKQKR